MSSGCHQSQRKFQELAWISVRLCSNFSKKQAKHNKHKHTLLCRGNSRTTHTCDLGANRTKQAARTNEKVGLWPRLGFGRSCSRPTTCHFCNYGHSALHTDCNRLLHTFWGFASTPACRSHTTPPPHHTTTFFSPVFLPCSLAN